MNNAILEIKKLNLSFDQKLIFENFDFEILANEVTAVVGPSGCGKSSFLLCLNRMIELEANAQASGEVLFHGKPLRDYPVAEIRKRIAMVYQKPTPFPFSIEKNFQIPLQEAGYRKKHEWFAKMQEVLELVGLWEEVRDRLSSSALKLSGGQQQRLCIARALALDPEVLLMDEPCSALDPLSSRKVEELVSDLKRVVTVVMVTHNLAQAKRLSQRTVFCWWKDGMGCLMEKGPTKEIFANPHHAETKSYIQSERV